MSFALPQPGEKWKYVAPSEATPNTPPWMIEHPSDKRLVWDFQGQQRVLQEGPCAPFDSVSELFALVDFLEDNPDFTIIYSNHQFPVKPENITELPTGGVRFIFPQLPEEPPAMHTHGDVSKLRALYIHQLPWSPIPRPYRWWLRSSAPSSTALSFSRTDPAYARQIFEKLAPDAEQRLEVLMLFAELIRDANVAPQNWGITLHDGEVALNVGGGYYCLWLRRNSLTMMWKGTAVDAPEGTMAQYSSIPDSWSAKGPIAEALTWVPAVRPQMSELIAFTNAKSRVLQGKARKAHSPGVLRYIEEELGITLPDPVYPNLPAGFTWIPFFEELTEHVMTYRDRQPELIALLKKLEARGRKTAALLDEDTQGNKVPLKVLDPFTFFSHFCRAITLANKKEIFIDLKAEWDLVAPVPADVDGIPLVNNQSAWFFSYAPNRDATDIDDLWDIAGQGCEGIEAITETAWKNALDVRLVGLTKLTMGLFWLNPYEFLALDQNVRAYLVQKGVSVPANPTLTQYRTLVAEAQERTGKTIPEISLAAYRNAPLESPIVAAPTVDMPVNVISSEPLTIPNLVLNTILYGPPGTGKTYETAARAVRLIDGDASTNRAALMRRYKMLEQVGNIAFVTFHQSFSYEDFVEGIRPVMGLDEDSEETERDETTPRYECAPGLLHRIATRALHALLEPIPDPSPTAPAHPSFDNLWRALVNQVMEEPEREYPVIGSIAGARYRLRPTQTGTMEGQNVTTKQMHFPYRCGRERLRPVYEVLREQAVISPQDVKKALQVGAHYSFMATLANLLRKIEAETPVDAANSAAPAAPALTAADKAAIVRRFLRNGEGSGYRIKSSPAEWQRFVLVIDEINRGNISKILGELITLLEEDKRVGMPSEQIVTLPYSREKFALPPNLYVVGTMNTADKSIALVDTALRRRFEFEELRPDFSAAGCPGLTDEMRTILYTLNQRITLRKDRDHRIGHAFFVGVASEPAFDRVFERKIVPLLGEYFYGDWDGLRWVLGEKDSGAAGFVRRIPGSNNDRAVRNQWQWYVDASDGTAFRALTALRSNYQYALGSTEPDSDELATPPSLL